MRRLGLDRAGSLGEADSIDMVLTFRNTHGWINDGLASAVFSEFARVLKPGGILGVVQHRAADGSDPAESAKKGYVSEQAVIELEQAGSPALDELRSAGLFLEARSEVNANPADTKGHDEGVWRLPTVLSTCRELENADEKTECEAPYRAIGESDRMTLRFRKPLQ